MTLLLKYFLERMRERSTWLGFSSILTALGLTFSPDQSDAVISVGLSLAGLVAVLTKDKK